MNDEAMNRRKIYLGVSMLRDLSLVVIKDNTQSSDWGVTLGGHSLLFVSVLGPEGFPLGMRPGRSDIKGRPWLY